MRDEFLDPSVGHRRLRRRATDDLEIEAGLRPRALDEFVGQRELKEHLTIVLEAARKRNQTVDHLLFAGPPGLGKTTLAGIVATEMGVHLHVTSGPALERAGDLAAILTKLDDGDVLFIDEIHRLSRAVEEILYPAMEDFQIDIVVGKGPAASSIRLTMPPFTLVGATTRTGMITGPLRDRFGLVARLDYYDDHELQAIVRRAAGILDVTIDDDGAWEIARRSRGTPRIANRLLRRVRDFAEVRADGSIDADDRPRRAGAVRRRRSWPRQGRPGDPHRAVRAVQRRSGRAVARWRSASASSPRRRGHVRAVPHHAGDDRPHTAWPHGPRRRLRAHRRSCAPAARQRQPVRLTPWPFVGSDDGSGVGARTNRRCGRSLGAVQIADFDYELPDDRIAQTPIEPRDSARLLVDRGSRGPNTGTFATSRTCCARVICSCSTRRG